MKKILYLLAVLVLGVGIALAQQSGTTGATSNTGGTSAQSGSATGNTSGNAADQTSTSTQTTDQTANTQTSDQTGANATNKKGNRLPQTASPLPLLGLLGLTSVGGALIARKRKH